MHWRYFISLLSFIILALLFVTIGLVTESTTMKWVAHTVALALVLVGLGVNSLIIALHTDKRMNKMDETLVHIKGLQEEIQKGQKEQEGSHSPIVASLQSLSQYYLDYMAKQKGTDEKGQ